jgi:hypothetical protein
MSIDNYIARIDRVVSATTGLSVHDLPDVPFYDWYEDEVSPKEAATMVLEEAGFEF